MEQCTFRLCAKRFREPVWTRDIRKNCGRPIGAVVFLGSLCLDLRNRKKNTVVSSSGSSRPRLWMDLHNRIFQFLPLAWAVMDRACAILPWRIVPERDRSPAHALDSAGALPRPGDVSRNPSLSMDLGAFATTQAAFRPSSWDHFYCLSAPLCCTQLPCRLAKAPRLPPHWRRPVHALRQSLSGSGLADAVLCARNLGDRDGDPTKRCRILETDQPSLARVHPDRERGMADA